MAAVTRAASASVGILTSTSIVASAATTFGRVPPPIQPTLIVSPRDGSFSERELSVLDDVEVGARVSIQRVGDRDADQLRYLAEIGIIPGRRVEVLARAPFGGPISLRVGKSVRSIGPALAKQILVAAV